MNRLIRDLALGIFLIVLFVSSLEAQKRTIGLLRNLPGTFNGYTLFAPLGSTTTYLINIDGNLVHSWAGSYRPGQSVYLLENGNLLRTAKANNQTFPAGGSGGRIQEFTWEGTLVWNFEYSSNRYVQHHDIERLPNGHVLLIAWEFKTAAEAIAAGRNPGMLKEGALWPDTIVEVEPTGLNTGKIDWEWHIWDHLIQDYDSTRANYGVVAEHPELLDLNYVRNPNNAKADWNHSNSIDYNPALDQILLSVHGMSEIYVIDHSTTTAEAAGHTGGNSGKGGDILYRWGNPRVYRTGSLNDQKLFAQHDAQWIESGMPGAGNVLVFNNGMKRPEGQFSTVDEIEPPVDGMGGYLLTPGSAYGPLAPTWSYSAPNPTDFYSQNISGAQRLANGNTLICSGTKGRFFEVTSGKKIVWEYINPVSNNGPLTQGDPPVKNNVFRCYRYAAEYPGLAGKQLISQGPIEKYPSAVLDSEVEIPQQFNLYQNYPNPFNPQTVIPYQLSNAGRVLLTISNLKGQQVKTLVRAFRPTGYYEIVWDGTDRNGQKVSSGIYLYKLQIEGQMVCKKMVLIQ